MLTLRYTLFAAILLTLIGCTPVDESNNRVVIGGPNNISLLVLVAEERGYFDTEEVDVEFLPLQTGKIAQDALVSGDIDVGVLVDANIAFVRFQGDNDVRVFASIQEKFDDALVVRADRGINTPQDLRGRTIGYLPATTSHVFLSRYLEFYGIEEDQVTLIAMPPPALQAAIIRGDVDAVSVWQPFRYNALQALDERGAEFNNADVYLSHAVIAANKEFLDKRGKDVEGILRALLKAEYYVEEFPIEARTFLAEAIGVSEIALTTAWNEYQLRVSLDQGLVDLLAEEGSWIAKTQDGFTELEIPDYNAAISIGALLEVSPDRIQLDLQ